MSISPCQVPKCYSWQQYAQFQFGFRSPQHFVDVLLFFRNTSRVAYHGTVLYVMSRPQAIHAHIQIRPYGPMGMPVPQYVGKGRPEPQESAKVPSGRCSWRDTPTSEVVMVVRNSKLIVVVQRFELKAIEKSYQGLNRRLTISITTDTKNNVFSCCLLYQYKYYQPGFCGSLYQHYSVSCVLVGEMQSILN